MQKTRADSRAELDAIRCKIDGALENTTTVAGFLEALEAQGIVVVANIAHTGRMHGLRFSMGDFSCVGADLGPPYVWASLAQRLNYKPEADNGALRARRVVNRKSAANNAAHRSGSVATTNNIKVVADHRSGTMTGSLDREDPERNAEGCRDASDVGEMSPNIVPFAFSSHPSQEFVRQAMTGYAEGKAAGRIFMDHAPTGTGKSWALATETIAQVRTWRAPKTILFLTPEKRHLAALLRDLKAGLPDTPLLTLRAKADGLLEHGIPPDCPLREQEDRKLVHAAERAIQLVSDNEDSPSIGAFKALLEHERLSLQRGCHSWVEAQGRREAPNVTACRGCISMFPGNRLFERRAGPLVALATYEKLFFGLDAFEIAHGKTRLFRYSPFVSEASGRDRPLEDCLIICEEYSHGHQRIAQQIEERVLTVSIFEAAESVVRSFSDVYQKVMMEIESHDTELHAKQVQRLLEIGNKVREWRGKFWLVKEDVPPFSTAGRAFC